MDASKKITHEHLVEAAVLSNELLGATTVVLIIIAFANNAIVEEDMAMAMVSKINENIREIARTWHSWNNSAMGVQNVPVIEYGTYCNQIIWNNARHLNYSITNPLGAPYSL